MYAIDNEEKTLDNALLDPQEGSSIEAQDYKVPHVKIRLDQTNTVEKMSFIRE